MQMFDFRTYNCGGFALKKEKWVTPFSLNCFEEIEWNILKRTNYINDLLSMPMTHQDRLALIIRQDAGYLLQHYPELELIPLTDCKRDDRVIAYRIGMPRHIKKVNMSDCDFHFRVRIFGHWYEKCGEEAPRRCSDKVWTNWESDDMLGQNGDLTYDSEIFFFRYKELVK